MYFREDELVESSVVKDSLTTARDGKRYKTKMYNLDVIISVGYRVKSKRGTQFRQWARNSLPISKCGKHHQQIFSTGYDEPMHKNENHPSASCGMMGGFLSERLKKLRGLP